MQQDFGAKILADNLHLLTVLDAESYKPLIEEYRVNLSYAFAHLKRYLLFTLPSGSSVALCHLSSSLFFFQHEMRNNFIAIKSNVSKPRQNTLNGIENIFRNQLCSFCAGLKFERLGV